MRSVAVWLLAAGWVGLAGAPFAHAEGDPTDAPGLVFGMSTAITGPAGQLGQDMRDGVQAAFHEANASGGVGGRPLELIVLDDGYEPAQTAPNMRTLIEQRGVLGVIGNVGTPTAVVAAPLAVENRTLFFGAYTGAGVLRKSPPDRYVINYRASYAEETAAMVDALIEHAGLAPNEIGFFTQRDAYGDAGYVGGVDALRRHGLRDERQITHGRYDRNTTAVENAAADLLLADPPVRAVIMVGAYRPNAEFIRVAKESGLEALYLNVSFVGADPLAQALGPLGDGVIVTQVAPHYEADLPAAYAFRAALAAHDPELGPSFGSFEGYLAARILVDALNAIDGPIDREAVVTALESLGEFDLGIGRRLHLSQDNHQASHAVWPTVIRGGAVTPFDWRELQEGGPQ